MNFCKDCKHIEIYHDINYARCKYPSLVKIADDNYDLVTGCNLGGYKISQYCKINRKEDGACGKEGKFYEEKSIDQVVEEVQEKIYNTPNGRWFKSMFGEKNE